jgi:hypothetical protein
MGYALHNVYGEPIDATDPEPPERNLFGLLPGVVARWAERSA